MPGMATDRVGNKKPTQKNLKNPLKMGFYGFFKFFFIFYENNTNFSL
jgi:hypothetical protein